MKFVDDEHKAFFGRMVARTRTADDVYRKAFFYAIGLTSTTRHNIRDIYDFAEHCPKFDAVRKGWQTSTSVRVTRLAFNLYNGYDGNRLDFHTAYTPYELFSDGLMEFMFEAVRIRYPEYTAAKQEEARRFMASLETRTDSSGKGEDRCG